MLCLWAYEIRLHYGLRYLVQSFGIFSEPVDQRAC